MNRLIFILILWSAGLRAAAGPKDARAAAKESSEVSRATVRPNPRTDEASLVEMYRLDQSQFEYEFEPVVVWGGIHHSKVRFPSPLTTPYPENNTVHAEFFRPSGPGPFRCVIVLHIAGGDFDLSRLLSSMLAGNRIAALFVKLPYYGERRPKGPRVRMISNDLAVGLKSMRQAVLDLRRACDWIEAQPGLDSARIGILGVSLGGIAGGLASAIEPRISHACLIMGGAHLHHILYESVEREARASRKLWEENGGTRASFAKVIAPYDAATYADRLRQRVVFMISAREDETIPKQSTLALWEAGGRQRILWYPCGHYTMAKFLIPGMAQCVRFFQQWPNRDANTGELGRSE